MNKIIDLKEKISETLKCEFNEELDQIIVIIYGVTFVIEADENGYLLQYSINEDNLIEPRKKIYLINKADDVLRVLLNFHKYK